MEERYRILKKLAEGGSASTYLVWDKRLERHWVMKRIRTMETGQREALEREVTALRQIRKAGIPVLADICYERDAVCLIMEYMTGVSLEERIRKGGVLEEMEALDVACQIGNLLQFLHGLSTPLLHGDLKPQNLMFHHGRIALLDFGGAVFENREGTYTGWHCTPGYASPELEAHGKASVQSDIYAFGAVLFFMITGDAPRGSRGIYPVREQYPDISAGMEQMILTCTQKEPGRRYGSMDEVLEVLQNLRRFGGMQHGTGKRSPVFRTVRSVLLTEGTFRGMPAGHVGRALLLLLSVILSGISQMPGDLWRLPGSEQVRAAELLPVSMRNTAGEKLLVDFGAVYHTDENPVFELPLKYFEAGREYEVTISQREREAGILRERTIVICAQEQGQAENQK